MAYQWLKSWGGLGFYHRKTAAHRPAQHAKKSSALVQKARRHAVFFASFDVTGFERLENRLAKTRRIRRLWTRAHRFQAIFQVTHPLAAFPHRFEKTTEKHKKMSTPRQRYARVPTEDAATTRAAAKKRRSELAEQVATKIQAAATGSRPAALSRIRRTCRWCCWRARRRIGSGATSPRLVLRRIVSYAST